MAEQVQAAGAEDQGGGGGMGQFGRLMMQVLMISMVMNFINNKSAPKSPQGNATAKTGPDGQPGKSISMRNLFSSSEECDLYVHYSLKKDIPSLAAVTNEARGLEEGIELLWHQRVWYEADVEPIEVNISIGPFTPEALAGQESPYLLATLLRTREGVETPPDQVVRNAAPAIAKLRELDANAGATSLFQEEQEGPAVKKNLSAPKIPYLKTKMEIRPVFDQTVHSLGSIRQGPYRRLQGFPDQGYYQPFLYMSDFWLLEKDYMPLNESLTGQKLNMTLSYSIATAWAWSLQAQMLEQWSAQGEWGLTDTQRDSFMLKRLYLDTNPYLLAFSGIFIALHTVFSMLAFKNDIQFWRKNESMQGLSARSMIVSFVCQLIIAGYLLDSQETSRLIVFEICLDTALASWKLRKAVKVQFKRSFPFVGFEGQKGYENAGTDRYDEEAIRYMMSILSPLFFGYCMRSLVYGKHRGWWSFIIGSAAGGVYTFGFVMMTPQLYINYKLKSVEHLPWRALTYKAMNTFVDDIAALLIDMPMMHRLSCFRDDIIFFIYLYQRWTYRVDRTRPTIYTEPPKPGSNPEAVADTSEASADGPIDEQASAETSESAPAPDQ